jgi:hypothetical protein
VCSAASHIHNGSSSKQAFKFNYDDVYIAALKFGMPFRPPHDPKPMFLVRGECDEVISPDIPATNKS